ncbi:hypothetical protein CYMTET_26044, partial [Cymbomonas tetramitiformis]
METLKKLRRRLAAFMGLCQSVYLAVSAARLYLRELYFVLAEKRRWGAKEFNEDGKAHVLYDDGDEETLDLSKENFKIIDGVTVSERTNEAADTAEENVDSGGNYEINKRGGAVENFLTRSLCERSETRGGACAQLEGRSCALDVDPWQGRCVGGGQDAAFDILGGIVAEAENPESDAGISADTSDALGNGLSSLVVAGVVNPSSDPAAPNPAARGLGTLTAMAGTLAAGMVAGEDAATMASDVLTMRTQQEDLSDPDSGAFAAPLDTPGGLSSVSFPASLGQELARRRRYLMTETGGSTAINLFTSTVDPHANLTADSDAARALRRALLQALDQDAPEAASVSTVVTSIGLSAGGTEVAVSGLEVGITFTLPLADGGADAAGGNRSAPIQCVYYDEANATYSQKGCVSLPAPAPPGVRLQWRTLNVSEVGNLMERLWEVDNSSSSSWFLSGCEESFEAAYPEYLGTDAGMRKYLGEGCVAADPENIASCWWEWQSQAFVGAGCEWGSHVHCLCTHLTDFKATQDQELGSTEPPKGSFISAEDMASLSLSDVLKSTLLLGILAGLMGGAILLAQLSNYAHRI